MATSAIKYRTAQAIIKNRLEHGLRVQAFFEPFNPDSPARPKPELEKPYNVDRIPMVEKMYDGHHLFIEESDGSVMFLDRAFVQAWNPTVQGRQIPEVLFDWLSDYDLLERYDHIVDMVKRHLRNGKNVFADWYESPNEMLDKIDTNKADKVLRVKAIQVRSDRTGWHLCMPTENGVLSLDRVRLWAVPRKGRFEVCVITDLRPKEDDQDKTAARRRQTLARAVRIGNTKTPILRRGGR